MELIELANAASFLHLASKHLLSHEAENNILLSSALNLTRLAPSSSSARANKFYILQNERVVDGACLVTAGRKVFVSSMSESPATVFGALLAAREEAVESFFGLRESVMALTTSWRQSAITHRQKMYTQKIELEQRILVLSGLESLVAPPQPHGTIRVAGADDRQLIVAWAQEFSDELKVPPLAAIGVEAEVGQWLQNQRIYLLLDHQQQPRAMAIESDSTPALTRLHHVFTPPTARGRGYATNLIYLACKSILEKRPAGTGCILFSELANSATLRLYEKLGFAPRAEFAQVKLTSS